MPFRRQDDNRNTVIEAMNFDGDWKNGMVTNTRLILESTDSLVGFIKEHQRQGDKEDPWEILMDLVPEHRAAIEQISLIRAKAALVGHVDSLAPFEDDEEGEDGD